MKLYIVFVTFKVPGVAGSSYAVRYTDSQWASKDHAKDRKTELEHALLMGKAPDVLIQILEGIVADARIDEVAASAKAKETSE